MADIRNKGLYVRTKTDYGSPADKPFYYRYYFQFSSYSGGSNCEGNNYGRWDDCYKMPIKKQINYSGETKQYLYNCCILTDSNKYCPPDT